jgi:hypothetical protein
VRINRIEALPREIVVLNVVGSSPTGHPPKQSPVVQKITGLLLFKASYFDGTLMEHFKIAPQFTLFNQISG